MSIGKLLLPALLLLTAVVPLPTASASSCTTTAADSPCFFLCSAGYAITVSAPAGVAVAGNCGGATAACDGCAAQNSATAAQWSEEGVCAASGAGATCSAFDTASDPCTSDGAFALGIIPIVVNGQAVAYVDDRNFPVGNGIWVYLESGLQNGLQRGGQSILLGAEDVEICDDGGNYDILVI